ncbi:MAG: hypothetical protein MUD02_05625 [Bacteroidales bacterium]|jgi:hypothetical protein|nr:hypothetical protein [Bacteroidales bacterium]
MNTETEKKSMELDDISLARLRRAGRWAMFIGVSGLTVLGVLIAGGILAGTFLAAFSKGDTGKAISDEVFVISALAASLICLFPVVFILRFSRNVIHAVNNRDQVSLKKAIRNLGLYFTYIGLLIVLLIIGYLAVLVITGSSLSLV